MTTATGEFAFDFSGQGDENPFVDANFTDLVATSRIASGVLRPNLTTILAYSGSAYDAGPITVSAEVNLTASDDEVLLGVLDENGDGIMLRVGTTGVIVLIYDNYAVIDSNGSATTTFTPDDLYGFTVTKGSPNSYAATKNGSPLTLSATTYSLTLSNLRAAWSLKSENVGLSAIKSLAVVDGLSSSGTITTQTLTDTLATADGSVASAIRNNFLQSQVSTLDGGVFGILRTAILSDSVVTYDEIVKQVQGTISVVLTDVLVIADEARLFALRNRGLDDAISVTEGTVERYFVYNLDAPDSIEIADSYLLRLLYNRLLGDTTTISDEALTSLISSAVISKILSSSVLTSDGAVQSMTRNREVLSQLLTQDEALKAMILVRELIDGLATDDEPMLALQRFIRMDDAIQVDDSLTGLYIASQVFSPRMVIGTNQPNIKLGGYAL